MNENLENKNIDQNEEVIDVNDNLSEQPIAETVEKAEIESETNGSAEVFENTEELKSDSTAEIFVEETKPDSKKGAKVFLLVICITLAVILAVSGGYIAGIYSNSGDGLIAGINQKPTDTEAFDTMQLYAESVESVVSVVVYNQKTGAMTSASGVIFSTDGYIITCDHIYTNIANPAIIVTLSDGTEYNAEFIAGDSRTDISVIKIDASNLKIATFGDAKELSVGEKVAAIGYSAGAKEKAVFTSGYLSSTGTRTTNASTYSIKMLQTDTVINPGSSGGALYNMFGQVVGITTSKLSSTDYENVNYAVPSNTAIEVANSLIENGFVKNRGRLGITYAEIDYIASQIMGEPTGLLIQSISDDSSLKDKGLAKGDIITHINGEAIVESNVALDVFDTTEPGEIITLTVYSASTKQSVTVYATLIEDKGSTSYNTETENSTNNDFGMLPDDDSGTIIK